MGSILRGEPGLEGAREGVEKKEEETGGRGEEEEEEVVAVPSLHCLLSLLLLLPFSGLTRM
jgi:hypothetical protein